MSNIDRIPIKDAPRLMEAVVQEVQVQLGAGLQWLTHVFGKAEKVGRDYNQLRQYYQKHEHREAFYLPSVYVGGGKYECIVPDRKDWGNYAFFYLGKPTEVKGWRKVKPYYDLACDVNLVIWLDTRDIEAEDDRNLESIKSQVLQVLGAMQLTTGRVEWERIYEQDKGVFEEYSVYEMDNQYIMWPYAAFRFKGRAQCNSGCIES